MSRLLLDTSAYSAFFRGHSALQNDIQLAAEILVNSIVLGELHSGFRRGNKRSENETRLDAFLASPRVQVVDVNAETADRYAEVLVWLRKAGRPIPTNDIWIAASAMQHGALLITTDTHFRAVARLACQIYSLER